MEFREVASNLVYYQELLQKKATSPPADLFSLLIIKPTDLQMLIIRSVCSSAV